MTTPGDAQELARALVQIDSRNPSLTAGAPGESACASFLASELEHWGFRAELIESLPGRPSVLARIGDPGGGKSLMFNGHLDVVGIEGMIHPPFDAEVRAGRLYGRGAADMKSGVAAMCAAAWRAAATGIHGEIIIAAVCDEEFESAGTRSIIERGVRADAAIVTEPTGLAIMPAHKGFAWIEVTVNGRAAHGSRWELGVDAIRNAGLLLSELDVLDAEFLPRTTHALLGRGSLHASLIEGGIGMSTYPDKCVIKLERRTIPGQTADQAVTEIRSACSAIAARRSSFSADVRLLFSQAPSDVAVEEPCIVALQSALEHCSERVAVLGMSAWTDAALLNAAGIPAICFGPGDISLAHAAEEYIPLLEIDRCANVLTAFAQRWCN